MTRFPRIPDEQTADLRVISRLEERHLNQFLEELNAQAVPLIAASELRALASEILRSADDAAALVRHLLAIASFCLASDEEAGVVIEGFLERVKSLKLSDDEKVCLESMATIFLSLIEQASVKACAKALSLGYDYVNIFLDGNIITDIRPVFDEARKEIFGAIVAQTLRIQFRSRSGYSDFSIALDNEDVAELRDACEVALEKSRRAKTLIVEKCNLKAFIVGEETVGLK